MLAHNEYGLLAQEDLAGDPAAVGPKGSGVITEDTTCIGGKDCRGASTGTEEQNRQHVLLARGQIEDEEVERGPPECQRALNACSHQGEGGGLSSVLFRCAARG